MKKLLESCENDLLMLDLQSRSLDAAVSDMIDQLAEKGVIDRADTQTILNGIKAREDLASTAIGNAAIVPHVYLDCISKPVIAIARLKQAINVGAPDGAPVQLIFLLIGPPEATAEHLDSLAHIARLMSDDEFHYLAVTAKATKQFKDAIESRMSGKSAAVHHDSIGGA